MSDEFKPVIYIDLIEDRLPDVLGHRDDCPWMNSDCEYKATHHYCPHSEHDCDCITEARSQFQPWRWHAVSAGNHKILAQGERYFNEADALHAIDLLFGSGSNVYLRQHEQGNKALRMATT